MVPGVDGCVRMAAPANRFGWDIPRFLFPFLDPLVLPVHPHYAGRDDAFGAALEDFITFARNRSALFRTIAEYLDDTAQAKSIPQEGQLASKALAPRAKRNPSGGVDEEN